jgi:hypothetical protein
MPANTPILIILAIILCACLIRLACNLEHNQRARREWRAEEKRRAKNYKLQCREAAKL